MRCPQKAGTRGSLKWIQAFANDHPDVLDRAIEKASNGKILIPIDWKSPRRSDEFAEYRDQDFLGLLGLQLRYRGLDEFWPRGGPQWDALGLSRSTQPILVEAKANIPEVVSPRSGAGEKSKKQISEALQETADFMGVRSTCDWSGTFYQYANRLAHLYLLAEQNQIDAWLVFVYFIGDTDVSGPRSEAEWRAALEVLHGALGVSRTHPLKSRTIDVFLEVPLASSR